MRPDPGSFAAQQGFRGALRRPAAAPGVRGHGTGDLRAEPGAVISPAIASLADSALLLPASALLAGLLLWLRKGPLLLAWLLALALAGGATLLFKLAFHACGPSLVPAANVVSPSGHASFAAIFYGALALMLGAGRPPWIRAGLLAIASLLVVAVAISRVRTGAHSPAEVAIGAVVGVAAWGVFWLLHRRLGRPGIPAAPVAAGFGLAVLLLGGSHFSLEHSIGATARQMATRLDVCAPPARAALAARAWR
ncbi:phosphatase PAP2 family protein [Enterovirga sp.]|uniref:phosphatase PAP2 family protein n=1 Tax=Enterovirga sp. TaxID=2026350 RepID=UPI0026381297|nr:phosphatase PAP2 family protein [Enterovirga sp.]MDB5592135.1 hypothetical protein [Enterovirga sp.]